MRLSAWVNSKVSAAKFNRTLGLELIQESVFMHLTFTDPRRNAFIFLFFAAMFLAASSLASGQTPTNIQISGAVQQASVSRLGVNLSDETYWDSGQMTKNLVFENPGFEGLKYRMVLKCAVVTANTCQDDNQYAALAANYWIGSSYRIMSGASAGITGTVTASTASQSCSGCGMMITFDQNINAAVGDYFSVETPLQAGNGDAGWADDVSGGGTITTETTDLSPETAGKQALLLSGSGTGQSAAVQAGFDTWDGISFIQLNGTFEVTFRAKGVGGNNTLTVTVQRLENGIPFYLSQTVTLTNAWQDYTLPFTANETGSAVGSVQLEFLAAGASVELDDVSLDQTNTSSSNPTVFRDDVVNALKELNPGTIRMMAAGAALGSDIPNQLQVVGARYREGWNSSGVQTVIPYGIHEFLQLCQTVGADPWITIPTATTPAEMTDFIEYLTGNGSDPWSALRISRGQTSPWTSVFGKIHIELGNETWNGSFKGESMEIPGYPQWANTIFGTARQTPGFVASSFDLILDGWASDPGYTTSILSASTQHDSVDMAPYLLYSANNEAQATMFGALFAEPELFESAGGEVYKDSAMAAAAPAATSTSTNLSVYETNLGTMIGNITKPEMDALTPSVGAGIGMADHMLQMMRLGVKYQNMFALPQYEFLRGDGNLVRLWGIVVDMGTTNRRRPQFLTEALANSVIGGNMLQTVQTGANPTWNQPLSSDSVVLNGAHYLQSFAFLNQGNVSTVLFNLNQTSSLPVTLSGADAPTGSVQMTQITSANITDNNETSLVVQPTTQTLSGFNPATGLTLPPFSMTVLTSVSGAVQAPTFSVPGGTYSASQTVTISDATPGAAIYYSTDGSTPSANSTPYTAPVVVSASETLQAIAVVAGSSPSAIASASYVIGLSNAATPTFSVASGTYNSAQTVNLVDASSGASIYYTTNGSVPTTSSTKYTSPIVVSSSETINAIAEGSNYGASAVATATYTISTPAAATPTFSLAGGTYSSTQTVSLADATSGATIYYTTNGSTPTASSTKYTGAITVSASETIKAIATATNYTMSVVATAAYTINTAATATPTFSLAGGTFTSTQNVSIEDATAGATIYYTTNGGTPTTSSTKYTGAVTVGSSETIKAIATAANYTTSGVATATYTINSVTATPVFSIASGTYSSSQTVSIADATAGAVVYYTTNGSAPTTASTKYTSAITVNSTETIHAIAAAPNYATSGVAMANYTILTPAAAPGFSLRSGTYSAAQTVNMTDGTAGATIYFTTNGTTPTSSSTKYTGAIRVANSVTIKAVALATEHSPSPVAAASYTIVTAAEPRFSVSSGTYATSQTVSITDTTAGAVIYYTTNGATPTTSTLKYSGPVKVATNETIKAIAVAPGDAMSAVSSASYEIEALAPTFSLKSGFYASVQTLTLSDSMPDTLIYYTTNGSMPTSASTRYTGPIHVSTTETVKAIATATGHAPSAVNTEEYKFNVVSVAPVFSLKAGTYAAAEALAISDATPGALIYYTINGSTPTSASARYTGPIKVGQSESVKAIAAVPGDSTSPVTSAAYVIETAVPTFSLKAGTYVGAETLTLSDTTPGSVIYYTINGTAPNTSSSRYTTPIRLVRSETVKAIALAAAHAWSTVATAQYAIVTTAPTLSLRPGTYLGAQAVSLADATPGAAIYYTTNGSTPTASSTKYSSAIRVVNNETIKAIALISGGIPSAVTSESYVIETVAPTFSLKAGTYLGNKTVTLSDATPGASIFYTLNGATPTATSSKYAGAVPVVQNETIKAIALIAGGRASSVTAESYVIETTAPNLSLKAGTYLGNQTVTLTDATPGATIYYTTNGATPTAGSYRYTSPIKLTENETVKAFAVAAGHVSSAVASAAYKLETAVPTFSLKSAAYSATQTVTLADSTPGAVIYYTIDGAIPTLSSYKYTAPIKVSKSETVRAIAVATGHLSSALSSASYAIATTSSPLLDSGN
jgi:hypothetical protein